MKRLLRALKRKIGVSKRLHGALKRKVGDLYAQGRNLKKFNSPVRHRQVTGRSPVGHR